MPYVWWSSEHVSHITIVHLHVVLYTGGSKRASDEYGMLSSCGIRTGVLIGPEPDQEGNKLGSMSGPRAISITSRRELSSFFFSARLGAEGNSRHSERNISLFTSCSG